MALAIPNDSGPDGVSTFNKPFLIAESSDSTEYPTTLQILEWIQDHARDEAVTFLADK